MDRWMRKQEKLQAQAREWASTFPRDPRNAPLCQQCCDGLWGNYQWPHYWAEFCALGHLGPFPETCVNTAWQMRLYPQDKSQGTVLRKQAVSSKKFLSKVLWPKRRQEFPHLHDKLRETGKQAQPASPPPPHRHLSCLLIGSFLIDRYNYTYLLGTVGWLHTCTKWDNFHIFIMSFYLEASNA